MKRGRGRPKLAKAMKRTYVIPIRFNAVEMERLSRSAAKKKIPVAALLRDVLNFLGSPDLLWITVPETLPDGIITLKKYSI